MTLDAVQDPRPLPTRTDRHGGRGRWEVTDVRDPLHPGLRIDRVVVCSSGVHVVTVLPAAEDGGPDAVLVAVGHTAADVVRALLPVRYRDRVRPVLCVDVAEPVADLVDGVLVTTAETLEHIVRSSPVVLSTSEAREVRLHLEADLVAAPARAAGSTPRGTRRSARIRAVVAAAAAATAAAAAVAAAGVLDRVVLPPPW